MEMSAAAVMRLARAAELEERRRLLEFSVAMRAAQADEKGWKQWMREMGEGQ